MSKRLGKSPMTSFSLILWRKHCCWRKRVTVRFRRPRFREYVQLSALRTRGPPILQRQKGEVGGMWLLEASVEVGTGHHQVDWWKGLLQDARSRKGPGRKAPGKRGQTGHWAARVLTGSEAARSARAGGKDRGPSLHTDRAGNDLMTCSLLLNQRFVLIVKWGNLYFAGLLGRGHGIIYVKMPCKLESIWEIPVISPLGIFPWVLLSAHSTHSIAEFADGTQLRAPANLYFVITPRSFPPVCPMGFRKTNLSLALKSIMICDLRSHTLAFWECFPWVPVSLFYLPR